MLKLQEISKDYKAGDTVVKALKGINLEFRRQEFVAILGPSGCGKTTMLNIIGGLDKSTSGDLLINGKSTKGFIDNDWDTYRNNTIGFIFQSYNLIPHLTVAQNVEIAMTLSGVSYTERHERAIKVLQEVGLEGQDDKRPNQLSGGQMQRVAIARALVNDPKIILADEPTGALDTTTSLQIMDILTKISKERLIIMVTHNQEIAKNYSNRIIKLLDGQIVDDSNPYTTSVVDSNEHMAKYNTGIKKSAMSFGTALNLSFKNLLTKKMRTIITAFAGSIGIIGIALVMAISAGMTTFINAVQADTLSGFPITIGTTAANIDMSSIQDHIPGIPGDTSGVDDSKLYPYDPMGDMQYHANILGEEDDDNSFINYLKKSVMDAGGTYTINRSPVFNLMYYNQGANTYNKIEVRRDSMIPSSIPGMGMGSGINFKMLPNNKDFILNQYQELSGKYPTEPNQLMLVVGEKNRIDKSLLTALGIDVEYDGCNGAPLEISALLGKTIKNISNNAYYTKNSKGLFQEIVAQDYETAYVDSDSRPLTITSILKIKSTSTSIFLTEGLYYMPSLSQEVLAMSKVSDIALAQIADETKNVITGKPFSALNPKKDYQSQLKSIGAVGKIEDISIYTNSFDQKDEILLKVDQYNAAQVADDGYDPDVDGSGLSAAAKKIAYTDMAGIVSLSVSMMIDTMTIVLTIFAGISLVVSSIMIGIITYVSVVERTKEIGVLRALGARKKDISRVFNAETMIIGLISGVFGILATLLLSLLLNAIIFSLVGVPNISALPTLNAVILIIVSIGLTFVAGLIPSSIAAKKDPVEALRSE